jgi:hypothetical protein
MALPGNRGQYDIVNFPRHFTNWRGNIVKNTNPQLKVFDNVSGANVSAPFSVNNCRRFTVQTQGTIVCEVQVSADPDNTSSYVTIGTSTNNDTFEVPSNYYQHVRLNIISATNGTAWLLRDYRQGGA